MDFWHEKCSPPRAKFQAQTQKVIHTLRITFSFKGLTFLRISGILYVLKVRDEQEMKKETIFQVTFTNGSTVFIKAMDEEHAKRIVERNGTEWLSAELTVEMIIDKIEEAKN